MAVAGSLNRFCARGCGLMVPGRAPCVAPQEEASSLCFCRDPSVGLGANVSCGAKATLEASRRKVPSYDLADLVRRGIPLREVAQACYAFCVAFGSRLCE